MVDLNVVISPYVVGVSPVRYRCKLVEGDYRFEVPDEGVSSIAPVVRYGGSAAAPNCRFFGGLTALSARFNFSALVRLQCSSWTSVVRRVPTRRAILRQRQRGRGLSVA